MNMSYCMFENTYNDLYDCVNAMEDFISNGVNCISSESERRYAKKLIAMAKEIADSYDEDDIDRQAETLDEEEGED